MFDLSVKIRKDVGKKVKNLRKKGLLPAVLYGPGSEMLLLEVDLKEFAQIYKEAGESSLIYLNIKGQEKKCPVLVRDIQNDPLDNNIVHVDFYAVSMSKKVETNVALIFEGESLAVKDLEGTLIKNINEIGIRALSKDLPPAIKINIEILKTFEDSILVKDLVVGEAVEILREPDEVVASVIPPQKVEEELEKPVEEKEPEKEGEKKEGEEEEKEDVGGQ